MPASACSDTASLVPVLRYRNVSAAAAWLVAAFDYEVKTLVASADEIGEAIYAELVFGRSTIMLVPVGQSDLDAHMRQPDELGGVETQTCYVTVQDPAAHLERAIRGGAEIVLPLSGDDGSQRGYSCRDLEGRLWNFGTYMPARNVTIAPGAAMPVIAVPAALASERRGRGAMPVMTLSLIALATGAWLMPNNPLANGARSLLEKTGGMSFTGMQTGDGEALARAQSELHAHDQSTQETIIKLRQEIAEARQSVRAAEQAAAGAAKDLAAEYARRTAAEKGTGDTAARVTQLDQELAESRATLAHLQNELLKERSARGQSVQAAEAAKAELQTETKKREQLELIVDELDRKADDRMQPAPPASNSPGERSKADRQDSPQTSATSATSAAPDGTAAGSLAVNGGIPPETGSVVAPASALKPAATSIEQARVSRVTPERPKSLEAKRVRAPSASAGSPVKNAPHRPEDKPWPYNAW